MRRVGIFAHSTNPRGGVVHAMQLAEALHDADEQATLLAPAPPGAAFPRAPRCPSRLIPAAPVAAGDTAAMVATRIAEIRAFLAAPGAPRFDLHHAQDPITANALADLVAAGCIAGFVRTVHHLDRFDDIRLARWQDRAVETASLLCCVSTLWQQRLSELTGREVHNVGNGVDRHRFTPAPDATDAELRARWALPAGPVFLALGGVEARKNTTGVLQAFLRLRAARPDAHLLIAGGATLLDHAATRAAFDAELRRADATDAVTIAGVVPDALMPALFRRADALLSVSLAEGFGLVALEAMACGTPAIVSAIAPFTEHFGAEDCLWADPADPSAITRVMAAALVPATAARLRARGPLIAARFGWDAVAARHLPLYDRVAASASARETLLDA